MGLASVFSAILSFAAIVVLAMANPASDNAVEQLDFSGSNWHLHTCEMAYFRLDPLRNDLVPRICYYAFQLRYSTHLSPDDHVLCKLESLAFNCSSHHLFWNKIPSHGKYNIIFDLIPNRTESIAILILVTV